MALTQISTDGIKNGTITGSDLATNIDLVDNQKLRLGTGNDLEIYHSGSHSIIAETGTGILYLGGNQVQLYGSGTNDILLKAVENGTVELYYDNSKKFETTSTGNKSTGTFDFLHSTGAARAKITSDGNYKNEDNVKFISGTGNDLQIYHDGSHSRIRNSTGFLALQSDSFTVNNYANTEGMIRAFADGAVELYYDNVKRLETTSTGIKVTGTTATGSVFLGDFRVKNTDDSNFVTFKPAENLVRWHDNDKAVFGGSNDLQIFHDGSNSYIQNATGNLVLKGSTADFIKNIGATGAVELNYNNSKKFFTISNGVQATNRIIVGEGTAQRGLLSGDANGVSVGSVGDLTFNFIRNSLIKARIDGNDFQIPNDNGKIELGASQDLQIFHDGSENVINCANSHNLEIRNGSERLAEFGPNGAVDLYFDNGKRFATAGSGVEISNVAQIGTSNDQGELRIGHDGSSYRARIVSNSSNSLEIDADGPERIQMHGGVIYMRPLNSETSAAFVANGAVELYHDNNKKFETTSYGAAITSSGSNHGLKVFHSNGNEVASLTHGGSGDEGVLVLKDSGTNTVLIRGEVGQDIDITTGANFDLEHDSAKLRIGASNDLQLYHDGNDSYIDDAGVGSLLLRTTNNSTVAIKNSSANMAKFLAGDAVELYHNNNKKFETRGDGVIVTGRLKQTTGCAFRARATSDGQTVPNNTATKVNFGTQVYDYGDVYNPSNSRFTAPVNGVYNFSWSVRMGTPTSTPKLDAEIRRNGNSGINSVNCGYNQQASNNAAWIGSGDMYMNAGDYAELFVDQNTGSTATLVSNSNANTLNPGNHLWWTGHLVHEA